ncbi:nucleoside-diphosphate sugar epimerase/dehydratase [Azotosporobacter soli]|uniref:polysaccharide biosynthesis protein n=1 Tax=Azotosporobacter soli TaxID=3055040 RepID=UPI0031FE7A80
MRRKILAFFLMLNDAASVVIASFFALLCRLDGVMDSPFYMNLFNAEPTIIVVSLLTFHLFGLYNRLWRYAGVSELMRIVVSVTTSSLMLGLGMIAGSVVLPRSLPIISWLFTLGFICANRLAIRMVYRFVLHKDSKIGLPTRVLIIGAGDTGVMIAKEIQLRQYEEKKVIGFVDDSTYKLNQVLAGVKVLGNRFALTEIIKQHNVEEVIIAMPSAPSDVIRDIILACKSKLCLVKTIPGIYELIEGAESAQQLREVDLEDLLRRDPVKLDLLQISQVLKGKRVLVTGAGGSIGSELCRQIAKMAPASLMLLGKGENSIYEIHTELCEKKPELLLKTVIADVRDAARLNEVFDEYKPQVIFHAAAHKHVPLMEAQPVEAVRNNIFGTKTVAEAADKFGAEIFVMISTDKAINPTSVMGATKRIAELIIQDMNQMSATKFVAVRFGNVLGSRGSVVPLFKRQIAKGGPVTITHPDVCRYFMTIPEASQLVLQAGAMANGGEVFVLDMGEPIKIVDMACDLIKLSGLTPYADIEIKFTGLRPGEKMFEELLTEDEGTKASKHKKIFVANLKEIEAKKLMGVLAELKNSMDKQTIIDAVTKLVPSYRWTANEESGKNSLKTVEEKQRESNGKYREIKGVS